VSKLGLRRRLFVAVLLTVGLALAALVTGFNVVLGRTLDRDARDLVRSRATSMLATLRVENGKLSVGEAPDDRAADAYIWIFAGRRPLEQPRAAAAIDRAAAALAGGGARYLDLAATDTRLYAVPVVAGGTRAGTVVAGISLGPYEQTRRLALTGSLVFGAIVLVIVALAARWLIGAALRPVVRMTRQAATWSDRDLDRRFGLGAPHDELSELGATLDGLLDRLAASLRREQRFSAEVAHELRTPLARVLAETELALRRERGADEYRRALELVHANAEQLARTVDALVAAARYEAVGKHGSADARDVAEDAVRVCSGLASERGLDLKIAERSPRLRLGLDSDLAERILQPILENACRYSASNIRISIARQDSNIVYAIEDDGPGVAADENELIFEPGVRGAAQPEVPGARAGLGLALSRRLARNVDGDVVADTAAPGGRFLVKLPAA
jgi:signal transduction histidine kinase